jgi:hypothetical protein
MEPGLSLLLFCYSIVKMHADEHFAGVKHGCVGVPQQELNPTSKAQNYILLPHRHLRGMRSSSGS